MRKLLACMTAAVCSALTLGSCTKEVMDETSESATPNTRLDIRTRAGGESTVTYPVRVYVFGSDGACKDMQVIEDGETSLSLSLYEDTYDIYAIGGADPERYSLPDKSSAKKDSEVKPLEGKETDDLTAAQSHVTLTEGEENSLTLGLERKVITIKSITIRKVPSRVTGVSVTVGPLYQGITLQGGYSSKANASHTATLEKQTGDKTWATKNETYLFPSDGKPTISVRFTTADGNKSYTYTASEPLTANHKVTIEGTYTESVGVTVSGTITGTEWGEDKVIRFDFDEQGSSTGGDNADDNGDENGDDNGSGDDNGDDNGSGSGDDTSAIPEEGSIYKNCYVLTVEGKNVTLLSGKEKVGVVSSGAESNMEKMIATINSTLSSWDSTVSGTWRLPTEKEIDLVLSEADNINLKLTDSPIKNAEWYYYLKDENTIWQKGLNNIPNRTATSYGDEILRPVITITFP